MSTKYLIFDTQRKMFVARFVEFFGTVEMSQTTKNAKKFKSEKELIEFCDLHCDKGNGLRRSNVTIKTI